MTADTPRMWTPIQAYRQRREQRRVDAHTVERALTGRREMYVAQLVEATNLQPKRVYRALALLERGGRVVSRKSEEGFPRRRLYQLAAKRHAR